MNHKATRGDVARLAGVAESTVSRSLADSELITAEVKARVRQAADKLGYIPSRQASLFARMQTFTIGLVIPSYSSFPPFSRAYFPALLDGAVLGADRYGFAITIVLDKVETDLRDYHALIKSRTYDGLIFAISRANFAPFLGLKHSGIPLVLVNNYHEELNSVDALPLPGMRLAFSHACNLGHRRVGYIEGDLRYRNAIDRLAVFEQLSLEFGIEASRAAGNFSRSSGYRGAAELLAKAQRPTVIMTSSDRAAQGVLQYCDETGIHVPRDLSVIGYDNLHPACDLNPALSTVDNPISRAGFQAVENLVGILAGRLESPVQSWLETGFIIRESTGPAAS